MCFMNELMETEIKNMKQFIDRISVSTILPMCMTVMHVCLLCYCRCYSVTHY